MGTFRWLTVSPKGQPDHEIILMGIAPSPFMDEATCATMRTLVAKGIETMMKDDSGNVFSMVQPAH